MAEHQETARHKHYPTILLGIYLLVWVWAAINPYDRSDWWLENILVFAALPLFIWSYFRFRLSNVSYTVIFLFMVLHTIGSHYTYAEVPFGFWLQEVFGFSRNHYDRIVHFSFGFLLAYPIRELFMRIASTKGIWAYWLPFELTLAFSCLYELMEWITAAIVNPAAGDAFLGTQGDIWDAQKDMALAGLGAFIAMVVTAVFNWRYNVHFKEEIKESVDVKESEPLGEVALEKLEEEKERVETENSAEVTKEPSPAVPAQKTVKAKKTGRKTAKAKRAAKKKR